MNEVELEDVVDTQDELAALKARADLLGVKYHPSVGVDKLREKVNAKLNDESEAVEETKEAKGETEGQKRSRLKREAEKLVRIRVTCMNPQKKEWEGEIFTVSNSVVGTLKKYVPFNADEGWHVPHMIYQQLLERQCQVFTTVKDGRGNSVRKGKLIKEFAIEVLPPLTEKELQDLRQRQAMAGGL